MYVCITDLHACISVHGEVFVCHSLFVCLFVCSFVYFFFSWSSIVPVRVIDHSPHTFVEEESGLTLRCPVFGRPEPEITWNKTSDALSPWETYVTAGKLAFGKIELEDGGFYTCVGKNIFNEVTVILGVTVVPRLKFVSVPKNKTQAHIGDDIILTCAADSGEFIPVVTWSKKTGLLPSGSRVLENGTLVIANASFDAIGFYKCTAKNIITSIETEVEVDVLVRTCTEWRILGYTESREYRIDPDVEGPVPAFQALCNMDDNDDVGITIFRHDSESRIQTITCDPPGCYRRDINYTTASMDQIVSVINVSAHCEQFIRYDCMNSLLLNDGMLVGWWVSRDGEKMKYWGGAPPDSGMCACGVNNTCAKGGICNCDANDYVLRRDEGLLTDRATLPVTQLRFGDAGKLNREFGFHTLGDLKCFGLL